ncbi:MAG: aminoacyl-tRNA hydrolase [Bacilli bacterium]|jgi:PTH1 family peptidyl-tRNA hydrolase|nr:aminoacyl-tRNA hydrolase [Bacillota bacterium]NLI51996.1 aminoacyl-tRNA hydrolase [Erysipelotrichaceae bacterium]OQC50315.1 MAG: Peptidyl-tRNA hydrolase [Tenericutes bacterium ADurb.Bin024]HOE54292.1 aminoacyl-tRNA hydrolase [Bacilli bacterium]TAH59303.1 MAG: aminoacyl-tRNA hydrolase [Bacillota bacterium]
MKLFVGLGNPGKKYENTRHNAGFLALDKFAEIAKVDIDKSDFKGLFTSFTYNAEKIYLLKPQTYMNLSGQSVVSLMNFFKIEVDELYVIYDDMDISPGQIRLKEDGSSGGHKGMQNIIELLGTTNIKRIRIGIGKPEHDGVDHVLQKLTDEDKKIFMEGVTKASVAVRDLLNEDFNTVMNKNNRKEPKPPPSD